ncbi:MAG: hypothetical protein E7294_07615 [Lachnospiraceae bacterium]|jgi:glycogen operon protein|nr:hypothetical protein [Lachnospiraceae bacterium]
MKYSYQIQKGVPEPLGVFLTGEGIQIAVPMECKDSCGIILYIGKKELKIRFPENCRIGSLYVVRITGLEFGEMDYRLFCDDRCFVDPYCRNLTGRRRWGVCHADETYLKGHLCAKRYDWQDDCCPQIPFHESILYHAHVRGFTKHKSSKVTSRGTFAGAVQKIPYLTGLGITGVCFMPFYEFDEIIRNPEYKPIDAAIAPYMDEGKETWQYKLNYWGFSDTAFYYAPKSAYSDKEDACTECRDMIRAFHKAGLEVLMQMYFPKGTEAAEIAKVVKYWVYEYHVDGFVLHGHHIIQDLLRKDPMLSRTKMIFESYEPVEYAVYGAKQTFKNIGYLDYDFLYDSRKFLKGDADMLPKMTEHFRRNRRDCVGINQITSYNGFTMMDLVSYNRKHNWENGEENKDGNEYNYSWNCGQEGAARKKAVRQLRAKQYRNAICLMMFAQAVPMILAGDEFGNSHQGNNNAYCLDNTTNWLDWNDLDKKKDLFEFMRAMIAFRKEHPILHMQDEMRQTDYIGCGYPDVSYHGELAWRADLANYNRHIGILYCGKYARKARGVEDNFIYIVYNMYWEEMNFALPKLPSGQTWYYVADTDRGNEYLGREGQMRKELGKQLSIVLPPRSIRILINDRER